MLEVFDSGHEIRDGFGLTVQDLADFLGVRVLSILDVPEFVIDPLEDVLDVLHECTPSVHRGPGYKT